MRQPKFTDVKYVEECIKALQDVVNSYKKEVPFPITKMMEIINEFTPLKLTNSKFLIEHHIVHPIGVTSVYRKGVRTGKTVPTYKFRNVCEKPAARAFILDVLKEKYKTSQKNYEKAKSKALEEDEVDVDELNTTLDELLEQNQETTEIPLQDIIEKEPSYFTTYFSGNSDNTHNMSLEEAIKVIKSYGGTVTF